MTTVTHHGSSPSADSVISAEPVSALSAIGSAILPKSVISPLRLASWPSSRSVTEATAKTTNATIRQPVPPASRKATKIGHEHQPQHREPVRHIDQPGRGPDAVLAVRASQCVWRWPGRPGSCSSIRSATRSTPSEPDTRTRTRSPGASGRPASTSVAPSTSGAWCAVRPPYRRPRRPAGSPSASGVGSAPRSAPRGSRRPGQPRAGPSARRPGRPAPRPGRRSRPASSCPGSVAASVPSSSEYPKMPIASSRASVRNRSSSSTSAWVSPGKPTMKLDLMPACRRQLPDLLDQAAEPLGVTEPAHRAEHPAAGVLERQVEVRRHARRRGHHLDQPGTHLGRLQVADPDPVDPGHRREPGQQRLQQPQVAEILAVGGRVLADQQQFPGAVPASQPASATRSSGWREMNAPRKAGIAQKLHRRSQPDAIFSGATTPSPSLRRSTRGPDAGATPAGRSGMRAGAVPRHVAACGARPAGRRDRQQLPAVPRLVRRPALAGQDRVQTAGDIGVVVEAQHLRLGQRLGQPGSVPLGQAAGRDHRRALTQPRSAARRSTPASRPG